MALTLEDIAKISGFSRSTVSRVINGDKRVSESTREAILTVIQNLNFQPNLAARGLAAGRTGILGLVLPVGVSTIFADPFFPILISNISLACNGLDYVVMLWMAEPGYEKRMISKIIYNGLVDGVIVSSNEIDNPIVNALAESKMPFVLIGRHPTNPQVNFIDVDNRHAAREAVQHLIRQGRRRIAAITGPQNKMVGCDRYMGYQDALQKNGIPFNSDLVVESDFSEEGGKKAAERLLAQKPDAIFAASDLMAIAALRVFQNAGYVVPQDVAVMGFDDIPLATQTNPPLTTIRQPTDLMGRMAVEMIVGMINHPEKQEARHIILPVDLVIRSSCGSGDI
jgi:LacI family transcriptional regulator